MSITKESELKGMQAISYIVALTLKQMREYAEAGMSTKELDLFGAEILKKHGANSAPKKAYNFPGFTCICLNNEVAHGVPSDKKIIKEGDLINIDVSAELNGFWSDNGGSFVLGTDIHHHQTLVDTSKKILTKAIQTIKDGTKISAIGHLIETEANQAGYTVIRNLAGHGVGRKLHEEPGQILNYRDKTNRTRFKTNSVVAIETFISTKSDKARVWRDNWTLVGNKGGFVAQHEHTIIVTKTQPIILTKANDITA